MYKAKYSIKYMDGANSGTILAENFTTKISALDAVHAKLEVEIGKAGKEIQSFGCSIYPAQNQRN